MDYAPFGLELPAAMGGRGSCYATQSYPSGTPDSLDVKFSGKKRDAETGLDYFGARYFSSAQGRFTSPDEFKGGIVDPFTGQDIETNSALPYAAITDPQTLNKYGYVRNNPLRYVDPDGHDLEDSWDVLVGVGRGIASSLTYGYIGAPGSSDSLASRTGQGIGTAMVGSTGVDLTIGGTGAGLVTSPTVIGAAAGAAVAGVGVAVSAGAAKNAAALFTAPIESRRQGDYTSGTKKVIDAQNAEQHGGQNACDNCGKPLEKVQNKKGVPTPDNQLQRHHKNPLGQGGPSTPANTKVLCPPCHIKEYQ